MDGLDWMDGWIGWQELVDGRERRRAGVGLLPLFPQLTARVPTLEVTVEC